MKKFKVAVAGATGAVGLEMIKMLESRNFPVESIKFLASKRSVGKKLTYNGKEVAVELLTKNGGRGVDIALFSAGAAVSKEFAPFFTADGCFVIDNSSAWRMNKDIPLVVPEVNPHDLKKEKKLIANPNCSTIQMVVALKPLHNFAKIKRIIVSTYQAVSGAGQKGINELAEQTKAWAKGETILAADKFQYQIAFNLIPQIDVFTENGYTKEEMKMTNETKKIMGDNSIEVSATCVRVPVFRSHSESVWIETEKPISPAQAKELFSKANGIQLLDEPKNNKYPMPLSAENMQMTYIGRIRSDISTKNNALTLWIVSDNLLKGAALNAVQIAEVLVKNKLI
ncbi:aspartate-semialdehyde dehydrogenase [Candidatus Endomicrobiellum agilis]|uniref:aspartate-semialdehyde dehydrogenase n=1 Tax=Candidatus Endomicrobiellum agilis TaxID=3238957 RepID=UPI00357CCF61|nr:aspartate-semialdehyde dehydrogenase [Endomicrobium sp.]MCA6085391.1 aspartate-semialdehyde dehydrogenase [Endomicrobium sp.]